MTVKRRDEKIIRGQFFKRWRVLSTWKITIQSVMQLFSPIINPSPGTMLFNRELLSFWKYRDLEDPLDLKDLEDHVVNRYCKPIHYLWYIFLSPAAWLDAEGGRNTRSFLSCSKPSFSFFKESLGEVARWGSYHLYIFAAWDQFAFGDRFNLRTQNGTVIPSLTSVIFYPGFCYSWHGSKVWEALCPGTSQGRQK